MNQPFDRMPVQKEEERTDGAHKGFAYPKVCLAESTDAGQQEHGNHRVENVHVVSLRLACPQALACTECIKAVAPHCRSDAELRVVSRGGRASRSVLRLRRESRYTPPSPPRFESSAATALRTGRVRHHRSDGRTG